ncbi:2-oxoglutarate ferredoxin oxidoreductase subunit alpha, partial [Microbacterium sp. HSID17254]
GATAGTGGVRGRGGGAAQAARRGSVSDHPAPHARMARVRQPKADAIAAPDLVVDDPDGDADFRGIGWGSTYGPINAAARRVRKLGHSVATVHLRNLNPMPGNLGDVLGGYRTVLCPEMNLGQLAMLLRAEHLVDVKSYTKVAGLPFGAEELQDVFLDYLTGKHPESAADVADETTGAQA